MVFDVYLDSAWNSVRMFAGHSTRVVTWHECLELDFANDLLPLLDCRAENQEGRSVFQCISRKEIIIQPMHPCFRFRVMVNMSWRAAAPDCSKTKISGLMVIVERSQGVRHRHEMVDVLPSNCFGRLTILKAWTWISWQLVNHSQKSFQVRLDTAFGYALLNILYCTCAQPELCQMMQQI